ncbi:MAG: hypothetical protein ACQESL_05355, partial [Bacteroidota bacterium]
SLYQALRTYVKRTFLAIEKEAGNVPESSRELLFAILGDQDVFLKNMRQILESGKLPAIKTRIHGNYKLDKVLFTGKDFKIINFEGELERSLSVRKIKHSPLRDVATMLQSLHYAIYKGYFLRKEFVPVDSNYLRPCLDRWYQKVSKTFLNAYCQHLQDKAIIPDDKDTFEDMLNLYMFEKAIQELHSFVDHEPESAVIPLKILQKLK